MQRGDVVLVTILGGQQVERTIWEALDTGALICTAEAYKEAVRNGGVPPTVGFRREFIQSLRRR